MSAIYTLAIYIIGHFSRDLLNFGELSQNQLFMNVTRAIYYILPDLEKLNIKNLVTYNSNNLSTEIFTGGLTYGLLYTAIVITLAVLSFEFKEF